MGQRLCGFVSDAIKKAFFVFRSIISGGDVLAREVRYLVSVAENEKRLCHPCESRGPERKTGFPLSRE